MGIGRKEPSPSPSIGHQAKDLLLLLPLATKQRTFSFSFHWPPNKEPSPSPSIGHQAKNLLLLLPLATKQRTFSFSFHWPPSFGNVFTFLLLLFKRRIWMMGVSLFSHQKITSNSTWRSWSSYKLLEEEKDDQPW